MLKAMIVDDDVCVAMCLRSLINWEELGYEIVAEAVNGAEGFEKALKTNPDVIICDIKMPVMDGTELCRKIREVMYDVSIIFLSAYEDFATARLALKYNVNEYILKPINKKKVQVLSDILEQIAKSYKKKDYFNRLLRSKTVEAEIQNNLKTGNRDYFADFFEEFTDCAVGDFAVVREVCYKLINTLYDYLEFMGIESGIIRNKQLKTFSDLESLKKKMDMVTFTSKLYFDVLQFGEKKEENYYHALMKKIKEYIYENYADENFGVSNVAEKFNFSPDYLGKIFGHYAGTTISSHLSAIRLDEAARLLRETETPINDISGMVGYASPNYFAKVFKKKHNVTPSDYRSAVHSVGSGLKVGVNAR